MNLFLGKSIKSGERPFHKLHIGDSAWGDESQGMVPIYGNILNNIGPIGPLSVIYQLT